MPTYEYQCARCGVVEINHSISEPARDSCPICGGGVRRLISGGSGFLLEHDGFWEMGADGKEQKLPRSEKQREWIGAAGRNRHSI
jgi:putative FmdB family regulatory protein